MKTWTILEEEFTSFIKSLTLLKDDCNDVIIQNSTIRQRVNDRSFIFEILLDNIFKEKISLAISNIKNKLDLIKIFQGSKVEIGVEETSYYFSDSLSKLRFITPSIDLLDNKFIPEEEAKQIFNLEELPKISNFELNKIVRSRIKVVTQNFNVNVIKFSVKDKKVTIGSKTANTEQRANFISEVEANCNNCSMNVPSIPFVLPFDEDITNLSIYQQGDIAIFKLSGLIKPVIINTYFRAEMES